MKNINSYTVSGWMVNDLKLKGNHKDFFAIVWCFSQDGASRFNGSINGIVSWLGCSRPTAIKVKKDLVRDGLIFEHDGNPNSFSVNFSKVNDIRIASKETLPPPVKKLYPPSKETLPLPSKETLPYNNNSNNISNNIKGKVDETVLNKIKLTTLSAKWKMWKTNFSEKEQDVVFDWLKYLSLIGKSFKTVHPILGIKKQIKKHGLHIVESAMAKAKLQEYKSFEWAISTGNEPKEEVFIRNKK